MTKAFKELLIVFLVGAGALTLLWGFLHQVNASTVPGQVTLVSRIVWSAVGAGAGLIVVGAALGLFLKPAKK
jgi:VanZ family protein